MLKHRDAFAVIAPTICPKGGEDLVDDTFLRHRKLLQVIRCPPALSSVEGLSVVGYPWKLHIYDIITHSRGSYSCKMVGDLSLGYREIVTRMWVWLIAASLYWRYSSGRNTWRFSVVS